MDEVHTRILNPVCGCESSIHYKENHARVTSQKKPPAILYGMRLERTVAIVHTYSQGCLGL